MYSVGRITLLAPLALTPLLIYIYVCVSRFIQDKLEAGDPDDFLVFFNEMKNNIASLMMDSFGHFAAGDLSYSCLFLSHTISGLYYLSLRS